MPQLPDFLLKYETWYGDAVLFWLKLLMNILLLDVTKIDMEVMYY